MDSQLIHEQKLLTSIKAIENNIASFHSGSGVSKKTSVSLMHLIQLCRFNFICSKALILAIEKCLQALVLVISAGQMDRQSYTAFIFQYLLHQSQRYLATNKEICDEEKNKIYQKTVGTVSTTPFDLQQSTRIPLKLLKQKNINPIIKAITKNQITVANPQCIRCSQVFIRDLPIENNNKLYNNIIAVPSKTTGKVILERYINSICNLGGGVLLVGAEIKKNQMFVDGVRFKDEDDIVCKYLEIQEAILKMWPSNHYLIEKVLVHSNYIREQNVAQEYMRFCFRITVFPITPKHTTFIQLTAKGYQNTYQICSFNQQKPEKRLFYDHFYKQILERYYKSLKINITDTHQYIGCQQPTMEYSNIFNFHKENMLFHAQDFFIKGDDEEDQDDMKAKFDDNPVFLYSKTSLLIVKARKNERYIMDFYALLKSNKEMVELTEPYCNSFNKCSRSIWMLSHEIPINNLKQLLDLSIQTGKIPKDIITVVPVFKVLQLDRNKLSDYNEKLIVKKFMDRFGEQIQFSNQTVVDKGNQKKILYLRFQDYAQAIFSYMQFEEINIWPIFVKGTANTKKNSVQLLYNKN